MMHETKIGKDPVSDIETVIEWNPVRGFNVAADYLKSTRVTEKSGSLNEAEQQRKRIIRLLQKTFEDIITTKIMDFDFSELDFIEIRELTVIIVDILDLYDQDVDGVEKAETLYFKVCDIYRFLELARDPEEKDFNDATKDWFNEKYKFNISANVKNKEKITALHDKYFEKFANFLIHKKILPKGMSSKAPVTNLWRKEDGKEGISFGSLSTEVIPIAMFLKAGISPEKIIGDFSALVSSRSLPVNKHKKTEDLLETAKQKQRQGFNSLINISNMVLGEKILNYLAKGSHKSIKHSITKDPCIKKFVENGNSQLFMTDFSESVGLIEDVSFYRVLQCFYRFSLREFTLFSYLKETLNNRPIMKRNKYKLKKIKAEYINNIDNGFVDKLIPKIRGFCMEANNLEKIIPKVLEKVYTKEEDVPEDKEKEEIIIFLHNIRRQLYDIAWVDAPVFNNFFSFYKLRL